MEATLIALAVALIITALVLAFSCYCDCWDYGGLCCDEEQGSKETLYAFSCCMLWFCPSLPPSISLLVSGILCLTGPPIAILITASITFILLLLSSCCTFCTIKKDRWNFGDYGWIRRIGIEIAGLLCSLSTMVWVSNQM